MRYARLAARLYNRPLLVTPEKAEIIERVFRAYAEGRANELPEPDVPEHPSAEASASGVTFQRADGGYLLGDNGVAVVSVVGSLIQRGDSFDAASGMMGYNRIGAQFSAALEDPAARAVLLEVDSPGGEVAGCFDLAEKIYGARNVKPVWSVANEQAFSAGYAIASAASRLYLPQTGMVGSVGVIMLHVDQSKRDASQGFVYTPIFAGRKKNDFSSHEPLSERARVEGQSEVDFLYDVFVAAVAKARSIEASAVKKTEAGIFNADDAIAIGFADGVQTFSETLQALGEFAAPKVSVYGMRAAASNARVSNGGPNMAGNNQGNAAPEATAASVEQLAEAQARGFTEGKAEGTKAGATAERTRIAGILQHAEAEGRGKLAAHLAFQTETPADAAVALLAVAPKEAAAAHNPLDAAMRGTNPKVGADTTDAGSSDPAPARIDTAKIYEMRKGAK